MPLAILCPGQGSQHAHMFEALLKEERARPVLEKVAALTKLDLADLERAHASGQLSQNRTAQILIVGQSLAFRSLLNLPDRGLIVAGYSVGDLSAHAVAGAISIDEALVLADARGSAMDRAAEVSQIPLAMAGVRGMSEARMKAMLPAEVEIALVNGRDHVVIAGAVPSLQVVEGALLAAGAHVRRLGVTVASHTSYMKEAAEEFRVTLLRCDWRRPAHRLLSPVDGSAITTKDNAVDYLSRQIAVRLDWARTMEALGEYGVTVTLELGPGRALSMMINETKLAIAARSVDDFKTIDGLSRWIGKQL